MNPFMLKNLSKKSKVFWVVIVCSFGENPTFQRNIPPPSSGTKSKPSNKGLCYNSEDRTIHSHYHENLKSKNIFILSVIFIVYFQLFCYGKLICLAWKSFYSLPLNNYDFFVVQLKEERSNFLIRWMICWFIYLQ
jgi:hypothetical protein